MFNFKNRKMKKYKYIISVLTLVLCSFSCEEYLDTQPTVAVSEEKLFENLSGLEVVLNGVYKYMLTQQNGLGSGISGIQIYNQTSNPDLWVRLIGNSYYQSSVFEVVRTESGGPFAIQFWTYFYTIINNCNIILLNVDNFNSDPESAAAIKGQALAIRGYAYFNLIRYYQQTYSIAQNEPGVPIYLDRASANRPQQDRNTVEEVYTQILSDLNTALSELSGYERPSMEYINSNVVNGFLAQVYLTMENWEEAADHANAARVGHPLSTAHYTNGFAVSNEEWIWGFRQTENDNIQTSNLFSKSNLNGHRTAGTVFGSETLKINLSFVDMFDATDIRNQFTFVDLGTTDSGYATDKFRDDAVDFLGDMIVMRSAEMYLIEAEALAKQASTGPALMLLNDLQNSRSVEVPTTITEEDALVEAIWIEKRKEFYFEGVVHFDVVRKQIDLVKLGVDEGGDAGFPIVIPARDYRFIIQIPDDEINFGGITEQNPIDGIF